MFVEGVGVVGVLSDTFSLSFIVAKKKKCCAKSRKVESPLLVLSVVDSKLLVHHIYTRSCFVSPSIRCQIQGKRRAEDLVLSAGAAVRDDPQHRKVLLQLWSWSCTIGFCIVRATSTSTRWTCSRLVVLGLELRLEFLIPCGLRGHQLLQVADVIH